MSPRQSAILAAALYALNAPVSKLLLQNVPPTMMAGFMCLGAGIGMVAMGLVRSRTGHGRQEMRRTKKNLPYTLGILFDANYPGLARFLESITQKCVVLFDEFDKIFRSNDDNDDQAALLAFKFARKTSTLCMEL